MFSANRPAAEALDVPHLALELWVYVGFACLLIGAIAHVDWLAYIAIAAGAGILLIGLRATGRTSRPFDSGGLPLVRSTRAVGIFYALAGTIWMLVAWTVAQSG